MNRGLLIISVVALLIALAVAWPTATTMVPAATGADPASKGEEMVAIDAPGERSSVLDDRAEPAAAHGRTTKATATGLAVTVLDGRGAPVAGARVVLRRLHGDEILQPSTAATTAVTGRDGRAVLVDGDRGVTLPAGAWWVSASVGGLAAPPSAATVESGHTAEVGLVIEPALALTGEVFTPDGAPADGAIVQLSFRDEGGDELRLFGRATGAASLAIPAIPTRLLLRVSASADHGSSPRTLFEWTREDLLATPHLVLRMRAQRIDGRCVDAGGKPIADVSVHVGIGDKPVVITEADGRFTFATSMASPRLLHFYPDAHASVRQPLPAVSDDGVIHVGDVVLRPGATLAGRVTTNGRPRERMRVTLCRREATALSDGELDGIAVEITDAEGRFAFANVGGEAYELCVHRAGQHWPDAHWVHYERGLIAGGEPVEVYFPEVCVTTLRFVDGAQREVRPEDLHLVVRRGDVESCRIERPTLPTSQIRFELPSAGPCDVKVDAARYAATELLGLPIQRGDANAFDVVLR